VAPETSSNAELGFESITYAYGTSSAPIFNGLNLRIGGGEFVSVVGPSGCGKTTLLRLAAGLQAPSSGRVRVAGQVLNGPSSSVAVVFQDAALFPWRTARRNVEIGIETRMPKREARERSADLLARVGLGAEAGLYPHQLSGGMRQRVNLARALAPDPKVLLMDEPFAALDAQTREEQQSHLLSVWREDRKTVLFVTHDLDEAVLLADRVVVLGRRGTGVLHIESIDVPRPRDLRSKSMPKFRKSVDRIRDVVTGLTA
jgi:NitT/TauT family transport system ATP-binding protein